MLWSIEQNKAKSGYPIILSIAMLILAVLIIVFALLSISSVYSGTVSKFGTAYRDRQICWYIIGGVICLISSVIPLNYIYKYSHWFVIGICIILGYLAIAALHPTFVKYLPFVESHKGAIRWLDIGPFSLQPSEFAKFIILLYLASYYGTTSREKIRDFRQGIIRPGLVACLVMALIFLGKDLSTTAVTGMMIIGIMMLAGVNFVILLSFCIVGAGLGITSIITSQFRMSRIRAIMDPELYRHDESFQLYLSKISLGVGGLTGSGYSQGFVKTYIPEQYTDYVVSIVGEEFGLIGTWGVLLMYLLAFACICIIASYCRDRRDILFCLGTAILITSQAFVNIGVISGCIPPTGVTAPFLSYGGSSVIALMFGIGIIFNIAFRNISCIKNEIQQLKFSSQNMTNLNL